MNILFFLRPKQEVCFLKKGFTMRQGIEKIRQYGYSAVPVLADDGKYCGAVSDGDFLRVVLEHPEQKEWEQIPLTYLMETSHTKWEAVDVAADGEELLKLATGQNFVPVVDDRGMFIGIVTRQDVIKYFAKEYFKQQERLRASK